MRDYDKIYKKTFIIFATIISIFSSIGFVYCMITAEYSINSKEIEVCDRASTVLLILIIAPWVVLNIVSLLEDKRNDKK